MSEATVSYCILQDFYKHEFVNFANRAWLQLLDYTLVLYMYYRYTVCLHLCALYHTKPSLTVVYSKESHPVITSWRPCHEASWAMPEASWAMEAPALH